MRFTLASCASMILSVATIIASGHSSGRLQHQAKPIYRPTGSESRFIGTISFAGKPPQPKQIDTSADPICENISPNLFTEDIIVRAGKLANAFLYIRSGDALEWYSFPADSPHVSIARHRCRIVPHILGMQIDQTLRVANEDTTVHNAHFTPKLNPASNYSQPPAATPLEIKFKNPEVAIPLKCNQHPWERAYISVLSHPFFAVSALDGSYQISGLPPGRYTLVAWHERLPEQSVEIILGIGEEKVVDFSFTEADKPQKP